MNWEAVRLAHPNRWLIVEALPAQSASNQRRLDQRAVVETCPDGATAKPPAAPGLSDSTP